LEAAVTVKLTADDVDALDRYVRERTRQARTPLSRALVVREILREKLAAAREPA
jgi:hypothetical protein